MVLSLDHVHIYARDPDATIAFYEALGGERIGELPAGGGRTNHFVLLGGQVLAISRPPAETELGEPGEAQDGSLRGVTGVVHFGLNVADLEGCVAKLEARGAELHGPIRRAGALRYCYATGPDGVVMELTQYDLPRRFAPAVATLNGLNKTIHRVRRAVVGTLLRFAPS